MAMTLAPANGLLLLVGHDAVHGAGRHALRECEPRAATARQRRAPRGLTVREPSRTITFNTRFIESLQALNIRESNTRAQRVRITEGPTILSASYGSVKGRDRGGCGTRTKKGRFPSGKRPLLDKDVRTYSPAPAARCFFWTSTARSRYWSASLSSACCCAGFFSRFACTRSRRFL